MTGATLFGGGGGADLGMAQAGVKVLWGLELDDRIAQVARDNSLHMLTQDVTTADYRTLPKPDVLHASPPCTTASVANTNGGETAMDRALSQAVIRALETLEPQVFTLENVWGYRNYDSFGAILDSLHKLGYWTHFEHVNFADMGVPQTRRRLILRAVRGGFLTPLPAPVPWVGWYEAIEDLLPELEETEFAPWQRRSLQPDDLSQTVLVDSVNSSNNGGKGTLRAAQAPALTVQAAYGWRPSQMLRAYLHGQGTWSQPLPNGEPAPTITSNVNQGYMRASVPGRVVSLSPRCLARFQTFPDSYILPESKTLAAKVIGNAVPPLAMRRILEAL